MFMFKISCMILFFLKLLLSILAFKTRRIDKQGTIRGVRESMPFSSP